MTFPLDQISSLINCAHSPPKFSPLTAEGLYKQLDWCQFPHRISISLVVLFFSSSLWDKVQQGMSDLQAKPNPACHILERPTR